MRIGNKERELIADEMGASCARLMELGCDSIQIVGTAPFEGDSWVHFHSGKGNLYARQGAVRQWTEQQEGITLAEEIAESVDRRNGDEED